MFCKNCGTKAVEGDKFCLKCGTPLTVPVSTAPVGTAPVYTTPANATPPFANQPSITQPTVPPAAPQNIAPPPSYAPQPVEQRTVPTSERKSKFMPIFIASVSVVAVVLIAITLYFALGSSNNYRTGNESVREPARSTGEAGSGANDDQDSASEPDAESEDTPSQTPDETVPEGNNDEFALTGDGSGFIFKGIEFHVHEVLLNPIFAPADMPDGHAPFMVRLIYTEEPNAEDVRSLLYETGYFMVDGERGKFGAAMLIGEGDDQSIYSLVSSCPKIDEGSTITLHIGDNVFTVQ